jgi:hypothetical protein
MHQKYAECESSNKEAAPAGDAEDPRHNSPVVLTAPHPHRVYHIGPRRFSRPSLSPTPANHHRTPLLFSSPPPAPTSRLPIPHCSPPVPTSPVSGPVHAVRRCTCCLHLTVSMSSLPPLLPCLQGCLFCCVSSWSFSACLLLMHIKGVFCAIKGISL